MGIILAYHGRHVPLEELRGRRVPGLARWAATRFDVKKTAERYGLIVKVYSKSVEALRALKPPFFVFWEFNHFLVVEGFAGDRVYLSDPASGRRWVDVETFRESVHGRRLPTDARSEIHPQRRAEHWR